MTTGAYRNNKKARQTIRRFSPIRMEEDPCVLQIEILVKEGYCISKWLNPSPFPENKLVDQQAVPLPG